eukprot:CAMPEP_0201499042 /NCGR_PEP_ID=MMETSP0151_2-20130828/74218_1 /ASSEMBLY_ACC=CAM_ASM_000257 /TAXON_ID=200890 /ORGANISM="Paramoeba atlantica, Strain 621/1 / CCAP 1560/9" /LENGTH=224 /DNA_ID=CAMNT_0047891069 /DNA_START=56 /DNA_END=726 /DNA_ORIENTATION=-
MADEIEALKDLKEPSPERNPPQEQQQEQDEEWEVTVHVHDISQGLARQYSPLLLGGKVLDGLWHTNVVVYGREYYFGGGGLTSDPFGSTRWGSVPARRESIGKTSIPMEVFEMFIEELRPRYSLMTYDILENNCNAFSEEAIQFLTGKNLPNYIPDMVEEIKSSPMAQAFLPMIRQMQHQITGNSLDQGFGGNQQLGNQQMGGGFPPMGFQPNSSFGGGVGGGV